MNWLLLRLGVDPKRYRLLTNLFGELSSRREMMNQLGREGVSLKVGAYLYAALSGLLSLLMLVAHVPVQTYFISSMGLTGVLLLCILFSETSNSLVNPVEGLVLAHQPIDGATYTAAKLTHLIRIVAYLGLGFGLPGAIGGFFLKDAGLFYPLRHLASALLVGMLAALFSCSFFGWLLRFVPATRLKTAGQIAELGPWIAFMFGSSGVKFIRRFHVPAWLPLPSIPAGYLYGMLGIFTLVVVVFGIRSLSADYLVRASSIVHGGAGAKKKRRWKGPGDFVERLYGPAGRAGFEYLSRMIWRDWQVRRQLLPLTPMALSLGPLLVRGIRQSPFAEGFTPAHFFPHVLGGMMFFACTVLRYGSHPKAVWIFLLAPGRVLGRFGCGLHAYLWLGMVLLPNLILLSVLTWAWGFWQAWLFCAYSFAVASCYLAAEVRLIEFVPFSRQAMSPNNMLMFGLMALGAFIIAIAVALQHFVLFRSPAAVAAATLIMAGAAWAVTRNSLAALEGSMRYNLGIESDESSAFYTEIA